MAYSLPLRFLAALLLMAFAQGCQSAEREAIPTYPQMDAAASMDAMRARAAGVRSVSGEGNITLTDARGESVRLDAAFAFAPPDRARVRAYKFGQAVLDLTVTPAGTWLFLPRGQDGKSDQLRSASGQTGQAVRQWLVLLGGDVAGGTADVTTALAGGRLIITQASADGASLTCEVERSTLTPRRYAIADAVGAEQFALTLDRYQSIGPTVWPRRIEARSSTGTVVIEARNPELNAAAENAFVPPARAVKLP